MTRLRQLLPDQAGLLWATAAVLLGAAVVGPLWDPDLWWHLAVGDWIAHHGQVPRADPFAEAGQARPWLAHEWLFELLLHGLWRAGGEPLLVLVPALAALATAAFALARAHGREVAAVWAAPVVLMALLPTHEFWTQRPQVFTYLLLSWLLLDLQRYADGRGRLPLWWVGLVALWANLHGAFVVAALAVFAHLAGAGVEWARGDGEARRVRGLSLLLLGILGAGLVNPRGASLYGHAFMYASSDWHGVAIIDWQSPDFADPRRVTFALVVLGAFVLAGLAKRARPADLFLLAGFSLMALRWQRNVPLALIAAAPLCAVWLGEALQKGRARAKVPVPVALGLLHLGVLGAVASVALALRWPCQRGACEEPGAYPVQLAARLGVGAAPSGRGLNHFDWGGYLLWRAPGREVYIDGRAPELDLERLHTYGRIHRVEPDWRALLDAERVDWVVYPRRSALADALLADGWREWDGDEVGVVLARPPPAADAAAVD